MKLKSYVQNKCTEWASSKNAWLSLVGITFLAGSVAPIPCDAMLLPLLVGRPERWRSFFVTALISSVMGGLFAYMLGNLYFASAIEWFTNEPQNVLIDAKLHIEHYGVIAIFLAAILPIPFKILAYTYGAASLPLLSFVMACLLGRAIRFTGVTYSVVTIQRRSQ